LLKSNTASELYLRAKKVFKIENIDSINKTSQNSKNDTSISG